MAPVWALALPWPSADFIEVLFDYLNKKMKALKQTP
jgi:hypothetical protein